jgi:hypothetical protein
VPARRACVRTPGYIVFWRRILLWYHLMPPSQLRAYILTRATKQRYDCREKLKTLCKTSTCLRSVLLCSACSVCSTDVRLLPVEMGSRWMRRDLMTERRASHCRHGWSFPNLFFGNIPPSLNLFWLCYIVLHIYCCQTAVDCFFINRMASIFFIFSEYIVAEIEVPSLLG